MPSVAALRRARKLFVHTRSVLADGLGGYCPYKLSTDHAVRG